MSDSDLDVLEELAGFSTFHHPTVSPDGSQVAFYYDETGRNELFVLDVDTGDRRQISDAEVPRNARWFIRWAADSERIFYHLDENGDEQNDIHALDRDGTSEPIVELEGQTILSDVSSDGGFLLLRSTVGGQMNLYPHDLTTSETTRLTAYDRAVMGGILSPDGTRVAYTTNESDDIDNKDVYVASVDECASDPPPAAGGKGEDDSGSNARNLRPSDRRDGRGGHSSRLGARWRQIARDRQHRGSFSVWSVRPPNGRNRVVRPSRLRGDRCLLFTGWKLVSRSPDQPRISTSDRVRFGWQCP